MTTIEEFNSWLRRPEGCNLEFKAAKNSFNASKDLPDYCAALSNEGGGKLILGVDPKGKVVGTIAFLGTFNKLSHDLFTKIDIRVDIEELSHPGGRILIFHIPPHPPGKTNKIYRFLYISHAGWGVPHRNGRNNSQNR